MLKDNKIKISNGIPTFKLVRIFPIYYGGGGWSSINSWYSDISLNIPANRIPNSDDIVYVNSNVDIPNATIKRLIVNGGASVTGTVTVTGSVTFNDTSSCGSQDLNLGLTVTGKTIFRNSSYCYSGTIRGGSTEFYNTSYLSGSLYAQYIIPNIGLNINAPIKFYDNSYNDGNITSEDSGAPARFYDYSLNNNFIQGGVEFYNYSTNNAFLDSSPLLNFYDYSVNSATAEIYALGLKFYNNSINYGKLQESSVEFRNNSKLLGGNMLDSYIDFYDNSCVANTNILSNAGSWWFLPNGDVRICS